MADKQLRLYIWEKVLTDYTDGVIFALAPSVDEARQLVLSKAYDWQKEALITSMKDAPRVVSKAEGFFIYGGG